MNDRRAVGMGRAHLSALAALAALAASGPPGVGEEAMATDSRIPFPVPPRYSSAGGHSKGGRRFLRKGTRPKKRVWSIVEEIPPGQVAIRQAAGQRLERRADGVWVWPREDQIRYQREHP